MLRSISPFAIALAVAAVPILPAEETPATAPTTQAAPTTQPRIEPKPLSDNVKRGLEWLAKHQLDSGAWGQGEESQNMRQSSSSASRPSESMETTANVADTSAAVLALLRSGSTPVAGPYATNIHRGVEYVCEQVEKSDEKSLYVTEARNTRLQSKLGTFVDTFLAAQVLAEVKPVAGDDALHERVDKALARTLRKIESNQQTDGGWANAGWAPALAQGLASKCINRAAQNGAVVNEDVRKRAEQYARGNFDSRSGRVVSDGSAGVELYSRASNLQAMNDSDVTNSMRESKLKMLSAQPTTRPEDKARIVEELKEIAGNRAHLHAATQAVVARLDDAKFAAGFGSNGGEEFLSHMNIGEALLARGGPEWSKWDKSMTENMNRIQNDDGSWSGHHCITGRSFCTSAALMVLMVDRAPAPLATAAAPTTRPAVVESR